MEFVLRSLDKSRLDPYHERRVEMSSKMGQWVLKRNKKLQNHLISASLVQQFGLGLSPGCCVTSAALPNF